MCWAISDCSVILYQMYANHSFLYLCGCGTYPNCTDLQKMRKSTWLIDELIHESLMPSYDG